MTYNNYIIIDKNGKTATIQDNRGRLRTAFNSFEVACEIRSILNKSKTKPRMLKSEFKIKSHSRLFQSWSLICFKEVKQNV